MGKERVEYIDAMRGFTMILVVYSHVVGFCFADTAMGFNDVLFLFRLPCFFFISGWLFFRDGRTWSWPTVRQVVGRKFMVQLVPTFVFLLLLAPPPLFWSRLGATKGGYWFTFALFEFFVIYIVSALLAGGARGRKSDGLMGLVALLVSAVAFAYDARYHRYGAQLGVARDVLGFLSFTTWRYYLFFFLGTLARKHFDGFLTVTGKPLVLGLLGAVFVVVAAWPHTENVATAYLLFAFGGVAGMVLVFSFFRTVASRVSKATRLGRCLQYIGTRTLDIYLLHYFFLPRYLRPLGDELHALGQPWLDVLVAMLLAFFVVAVCLCVSRVLRLSPFLAHFLFGVRRERAAN